MNRVCYWVVLGTLRNEDLHYIPESDRCLLNKDLVFVYTGKKKIVSFATFMFPSHVQYLVKNKLVKYQFFIFQLPNFSKF